MDKLTRMAAKRAQNRVASSFIIEAKPRRFDQVAETVRGLGLFDRYYAGKILHRISEFQPFAAFTRFMPRFNMVSALLPRNAVYYLAELRNVERIYSDEVQYAFQYPVVPSEGIYKFRREVPEEVVFTSTEWTRRLMGADEANQKGYTGEGVIVSVIDTGSSRTHPQTERAVFETTLPAQRRDENGHGTWCVSCVGGIRALDEGSSRRTSKRIYCEGMAPRCNLLSVKSLGYVAGMGTVSSILEGLILSIDARADIVSMSLGGPSEELDPRNDPYYGPMQVLVDNGIIPVVAIGNSGPEPETTGSPGNLPMVLSVGAYNQFSGEVASFSSRGPTPWGDIKPDVVAPGVDVNSGCVGVLDYATDYRPNKFSMMSGTSMSTPHISGVLALMAEVYTRTLGKRLTVEEVKDMLLQLGHAKDCDAGWGGMTFQMIESWLSSQYGVMI